MIAVFLGAALVLSGQTPAGWKTMKDEKGTCQLSVPADWKPHQQIPGLSTAPDQSDALVVSHEGKKLKPMMEAVQKMAGVDKMLENTEQRVFYAGKTGTAFRGQPVLTGYDVTIPGKGGTCSAKITIVQGVPEELVKKIAATLSIAK
jgi:hypothetical protein